MTISILGAGWLGLPFGKKLVELGHSVKGSTTTPDKLASIKAAGIQPFLLKAESELAGINIDDFFNCDLLLLNIPPKRGNPNVEQDYPEQVASILQQAIFNGVAKCIFISSTSVYGNENHVAREQDALYPASGSGRALVETEKMVREAFPDSATILRMAGLTGPGRQIGRFLAGRQNLSNGKAPVNLVHLDDCIGVMLTIIEQDKFGKTYNVCADEHPLKEEIYPAQARKLGLDPPTFAADSAPAYKIISNEQVKEELGYSFQHPDPMTF